MAAAAAISCTMVEPPGPIDRAGRGRCSSTLRSSRPVLPLLLLVLVLLLATAATAEGMGAGLLRGEGPERELKPVEGLMEGIAPALGKASGVDADMVCDGMVLDDMLAELEDVPECGTPYARFYDRIREPRFNSETLSEQTKKLDNFCKTHCGTLLNEKVTAWREWCVGPDAEYVQVRSNIGGAWRMGGFVAVYGCMSSPDADAHPLVPREEGFKASYCATLAMGAMAATPALHGEATEAAVCAFYTSCCFGEQYKLLKLTRPLNLPAIEARCPGATKAFHTACPNPAASAPMEEGETPAAAPASAAAVPAGEPEPMAPAKAGAAAAAGVP